MESLTNKNVASIIQEYIKKEWDKRKALIEDKIRWKWNPTPLPSYATETQAQYHPTRTEWWFPWECRLKILFFFSGRAYYCHHDPTTGSYYHDMWGEEFPLRTYKQ